MIDVKAVVRQADDQIDVLAAQLVHDLLHALFTNAEAVFWEHPFRVGDRQIGEGLPDHAHGQIALLDDLIGLEGRFVPFDVIDIGAKEREVALLDQFLHALGPEGEFPVAGHRFHAQQVLHPNHVLAPGLEAGIAAVPGIAPVQQDRIRAAAADRLHDRCDAVEAAHLAIGLG